MTTRSGVLAIFVASATAGCAQGQIVRDMTPERVREAIALGTKAKDLGWYRIQEKARFSWPPLIGLYTTAFLRVALAANTAKKQYKPFTEADVTPDMITPEILVYTRSHAVEGTEIANAETIVLLPHNSKDASRAIHPTQMKEASQEYKNLLGFSGEGKGLVAVFPLDAWREDNDVHVVFDQAIPSSQGANALGGCKDCKWRISLDKVR
jgi:hypothetical protein